MGKGLVLIGSPHLTKFEADGGYVSRFSSSFLALGFIRFDGESALPPTAANTHRWVHNPINVLRKTTNRAITMNYLTLSIGSIALLIGLAIVVLTMMFLRENRVKNILTGMVLALLGTLIVLSSLQERGSLQINIGISNKQFSFLLIGFVMSLFILKGILDLREGKKNLQDRKISPFLIFKNKFQIVVAVIVTTWVILILVVAFTQFGR
jgi:hypothetical protein